LSELLAVDRHGWYRQAQASAQQAVRLARTSEEMYWPIRLLTSIECGFGNHHTEIRYARRLMALQPRREDSLAALRHAARCNGLALLERRMEAALQALYAARDAARVNRLWPAPSRLGGNGR
jgi:hypothetical protein